MEITNNKKVIIINGKGEVGKDTFVKMVQKYVCAYNYSSVDYIKSVANKLGYLGGKTLKDRKFLSDLKMLSSEYNDLPFKDVTNRITEFIYNTHNNTKNDNEYELLFVHIREPKEIRRVLKFCFMNGIEAYSLLITNTSKPYKHYGNIADDNVCSGFDYDYTIDNNRGLQELEHSAVMFLDRLNIEY